MFNFRDRKKIEFFSNPPLPDKVVVVPALDENSGNFVNHFKYIPQDNKSPLEGLHFNPDTMSLRAKLNLGIPMSQVAMPSMEDDPNRVLENLYNAAHRVDQLLADSAALVDSPGDSLSNS